ncbi:tyrosine-type recombinase/integrase [Kutzneria albida]|uniref:Tyr recombinase domain-containing protein n=1 Tax=Kutzneria albida DSM 43870 TaxID=1449976 RepID=W5WC92_9PSEU|nr:tyrosine-type recombinase/integrase [Kutzneria albida]AHH98522.1 hypothetical protein KALB_5160 [Kutzneria albida DSM 43870]
MTINVDTISRDASTTWLSFLRDWDRTLRAGNHPETTRYNYLLAAAQLARFLRGAPVGLDASEAADDPTCVRKEHVEAFQVWMIETRSAATALNKHKVLQQFFKWMVVEEEIDRSPMERVRQPKVSVRLVPVIRDDDTRKVLATCGERRFLDLRDEAIIRLYYNTGARLAEVANLALTDVDLTTDSVRYLGKGGRERRVRFGPKTARAISRYLRVRARHRGADQQELWLADRGTRPLRANGIKIRLKRRGLRAGVANVHAHRWRHNYAHEWKRAGGDSGDLMLLLGWTSEDMVRHYGASAAAERAQENQARLRIGENV